MQEKYPENRIVEANKLMKISDIKTKYPLRTTQDHLQPLIDSIEDFGLINNPKVSTNKYLISGKRRIKALKKMGYTHVKVDIIDVETLALGQVISASENLTFKINDQRIADNKKVLLNYYKKILKEEEIDE